MVDLDWKFRFEKDLDKIFAAPAFVIEFNHFITTETGQKWLKSEHGLRYIEWQEL